MPDAAAEEEAGVRFLRADHLTVAGNLRLAARVADLGPLDVLVNNVGGSAFPRRTVTPEGHETVLALNYVGPVALTMALQAALAPQASVVQVVSSAFSMHTGDPFGEPAHYTAIGAYARAKQLNLLATLHLVGSRPELRVNAVNPGMAWTPGVEALTPEAVPQWPLVWPVVRMFQRRATPAKAARVPASVALDPPGTGLYVESNGRPAKLHPRLLDPAWQQRAWDDVAALVTSNTEATPERHDET